MPNIDDLLKNITGTASGTPPTIASEEVKEKFEEKMQQIEIKEKERATEMEAARLGLPYVNLLGFPIPPDAIGTIPEEQAKELGVICFLFTGEELRIATTNPESEKVKELLFQLEERNHAKGKIYLISEHSFGYALKLYAALPKFRRVTSGIEITEEQLENYRKKLTSFKSINDEIQGAPMTEVFIILMAGALEMDASDIHIEAEEQEVKVRYRIDGALQDVATLPRKLWPQVISRIKGVAGLKINIADIPQDGRITIFVKKEKIEIRVSTLPSAYGESAVMRLLRSTAGGLNFEALGLRGKTLEDLQREVSRPNGMIITTGPTGSGKTTTLYSILSKLNNPEIKIITLEDPVEYKISGITQSQIDPGKEYTFAKGLRAILRQDPDIIMVGEIRDLETADIAIQAALTGHLVLSTIHTNDAAGAIPRFISLGVKSFLLAPAVNAVIGQRLIRKICEHCKEEFILPEETLKRVKEILAKVPANSGYKIDLNHLKFYRGKGCDYCNGHGLKGRVGIYEVFTINQEIEKMILGGQVSEYEMRDVTQKYGMISMVQDGLLKAMDGITTVDEVFSATE